MSILMSETDEQLVTRLIARDQSALTALYTATLAKVYGLALKITRQPSLAEEVVEDTYWQVWQEICRYDAQKCPLLSWMLMICRSRAIDALRKRQKILEVVTETEVADDEAELSVEAQLIHKQDKHALQMAFQSLNATQKQVLHHSFYFGLSHQEIAHVMQLPLGTVKSTIKRAQTLLKNKLKGQSF